MTHDLVLVRTADDRAEDYFVPGMEDEVDPHWLESLGMGYVAAWLRHACQAQVSILDGTIDPITVDEIVDRVIELSPRMVGFSVLLDGYPEVRTTCRMLRDRGYAGHITIGQHFATFNAERVLADNPTIDSVVRFEGEKTAEELLLALRAGGPIDDIAGLVVRDGKGGFKVNPPRPLLPDLDALPFPARDVLERNLGRVRSVSISGSRGCPWRCKFCSISTFYRIPKGSVWRHRSPKNIVDEMASIVDRFGKRTFTFADDQFMGAGSNGRAFARSFAEELIARKLDVEFAFETRADSVDREIFTMLRDAGLIRVFVGIESGYQPTLNFYQKDITVERNVEAIAVLQELGLDITMGFIMFHERSTLQEVKANLEFLRDTQAFNMTTMYGVLELRAGTKFMGELGDGTVNELYQGQYDIRDQRAKNYKVALQQVLQPLATPMLYAHNRKRLKRLHPEILAGAEREVRAVTLDTAFELLELAQAAPIELDVIDSVRRRVSARSAQVQLALELADVVTNRAPAAADLG